MDGIGLWAPSRLRAALRTLFPNLRPLCSVEEPDTCSEALPLLLTGEGIASSCCFYYGSAQIVTDDVSSKL